MFSLTIAGQLRGHSVYTFAAILKQYLEPEVGMLAEPGKGDEDAMHIQMRVKKIHKRRVLLCPCGLPHALAAIFLRV